MCGVALSGRSNRDREPRFGIGALRPGLLPGRPYLPCVLRRYRAGDVPPVPATGLERWNTGPSPLIDPGPTVLPFTSISISAHMPSSASFVFHPCREHRHVLQSAMSDAPI